MKKIANKKIASHKAWFFFTLLYLIVDYGRPQDILPIGFMRPGMLVLIILTFFLIFGSTNPRFFKIKQIKMLLYFIMLLAAFIPFAKNNFYAYQTTRIMLIYMPFILSIAICVNSIERLKKFTFIWIALTFYVSLYAIFHQGQGSGSYFKDENDIALFINAGLPFCYFLFLCEKGKLKKFFYLSTLITGIMTLIISFSRGGFIGFASMIIAIMFLSPKKMKSLVLIALVISIFLFYARESYWEEMSTISNATDSTFKARFLSWQAAWKMFLDNPLGVGGNNFQVRFEEYQSGWFQRGMWGRVAHSLWFTLISELGIIGIIIYFRLLYYNLKDIFVLKKINASSNDELRYLYFLSLAFITSFVGYFVSGIFLSVLYYPHYFYITAMIVASRNLLEKHAHTPKKQVERNHPCTILSMQSK